MNTVRVNIELLNKVINKELYKADVIDTCHPLLAGGGGVTTLTGVMTFVLAPKLSGDIVEMHFLQPPGLPVPVANIPENTGVIIDVPGPKSLFKFSTSICFCIPELRRRIRNPLGEHGNEALLLGEDVPLGVLPLLLRSHREPVKVEDQGPGTEVLRVAAGQELEIQPDICQN